jgi:hypothetical protein
MKRFRGWVARVLGIETTVRVEFVSPFAVAAEVPEPTTKPLRHFGRECIDNGCSCLYVQSPGWWTAN